MVEEESHNLNSIIDNSYKNQMKSLKLDKYKEIKRDDLHEPFL